MGYCRRIYIYLLVTLFPRLSQFHSNRFEWDGTMHWFCSVSWPANSLCECMCSCVHIRILYLVSCLLDSLAMNERTNRQAIVCDSVYRFSITFILYMTFNDVPHIFYFIFIEFRYTILLIHPTCFSNCWIILYSFGFFFFSFLLPLRLLLALNFCLSFLLCCESGVSVAHWWTDYLQVWLTNIYVRLKISYGGHDEPQWERVCDCQRWIKRDFFYEK